MYKADDISIIIPTYNRVDDLEKTLKDLISMHKGLDEIIIIDQSTNWKIRYLIKKINKKKIKYYHTKIPSLTRARNIGVSKVSENKKIICFLDDDVTLEKGYFERILEVFNRYSEARGVGGFHKHSDPYENEKILNFLKKLFFLGRFEDNNVKVTSVYGNNYARELKDVTRVQWFPGLNMCFKREIFNEMKFDENLRGYALAEDFDFTYRLYKKYPETLFINPKAKVIHNTSFVERYPDKKMAYVNQINHFYLNFKNFNSTLKEKLIFPWCLFGIFLLRILSLIRKPGKNESLRLKYFLSSLYYSLKNLQGIRRGNLDVGDKYLKA